MMRFLYRHPSFAGIFERPYRKGKVIRRRYQILGELGMGSYGIAYVANDLHTGRKVVVKQCRKTKGKESELSFHREADILRRLKHPQIPVLNDTFLENGTPHLVLDYVKGETVEALIFEKGKKYTEREAFQLLRDVLAVVEYIHANNIVHRDLRIPNILLRDGTVFVIDFGLARFFDESVDRPETYAPEKKLWRDIHPKSDFYALGHFTLFLLYSSYEPISEEEKSWAEELSISEGARFILRKMLQIDQPYDHIYTLINDVDHLIENWPKQINVS
jgi:serine/threonine-protein kinase